MIRHWRDEHVLSHGAQIQGNNGGITLFRRNTALFDQSGRHISLLNPASEALLSPSRIQSQSTTSKMTPTPELSITTIIRTDTCTFCLESFKPAPKGSEIPVALRCGHTFGSKCLQEWIAHSGVATIKCPMVSSVLVCIDIPSTANTAA